MKTVALIVAAAFLVSGFASAYAEEGRHTEEGQKDAIIGPHLREILDVVEKGAKPGAKLDALLEKAGVELEKEELVVIVTFKQDMKQQGQARIDERGFVCNHLKVLPMTGVLVSPEEVREMETWPEVRSIYWNKPLDYFLYESADSAGVRPVWDTYGEKGINATVMVIDSGVDGTHPDVLYGKNLIQSVLPIDVVGAGLPLEILEDAVVTDSVGHGTHCLGTVGGVGLATGGYDPTGTAEDPLWHEKYRGMAPECKLISFGLGAVLFVFGVELGFDYALEHQDEYGINVISNSWGTSGEFNPDDPVCVGTLECYKAGMLVLFAAGNEGPGAGTMNPYSVAPWVMAIAAGTKDKHLAKFSSRGTNIPYDHPDITAPGVSIIAAKAKSGWLQATSATYGPTLPPPADGIVDTSIYYAYMSGTSMACPHIAGIAALLMSAYPDLSPDQVMDILTYTAGDVQEIPREEIWHIGAGYVNAYEAYLLAGNTTGNMKEFLNGTCKYASGGTDLDPEYEIDCVNVGYDYWPEEEKPVVQEISPKEEKSWLPGFGAVACLAAVVLLAVALRKRRNK